jgi:RNA polymerase-binding transcription factor DksA
MPRATTSSTSSSPRRPATPAKKASVKSTSAKTSAAKKATVKKAAVKRAVPAKKAAVKKAVPAKKAAVKKAVPAKKAPAKKSTTVQAKGAPVAKKAAPAAPTAKKSAPAKKAAPKKVVNPFDAKFLDAQKALLHEERARLVRDADNLTAEAISLAEGRDPGDVQFDEESGEGDTLQVERERDLALSAQFRSQVEEIDRALEKFALGTYGICEVSGTAIPKERLRAIPWARERVEYKVGGFGRR